jgi:hypothetical protein
MMTTEDPHFFLKEMSELYSDSDYRYSNSFGKEDEIVNKTRQQLMEWRCRGIDVASYINEPIYENGETELMLTFRWERNIDLMMGWFKLLVEFGGNPRQNNKNGLDGYNVYNTYNAYDIAKMRFIKDGAEDRLAKFLKEVEEIIANRNN